MNGRCVTNIGEWPDVVEREQHKPKRVWSFG